MEPAFVEVLRFGVPAIRRTGVLAFRRTGANPDMRMLNDVETTMLIMVAGLLTAVLMNAAFEPLEWAWLALVAMMPLLALSERRPWTRFLAGWLAGFGMQALGYFWIFFTIRDFGGLSSSVSLGGGLLFWAYQGLDVAVWLLVGPVLARGLPWWQRGLVMAATWALLQTVLFPYIFPWSYGAAFANAWGLGTAAAWWTMSGLSFLAILVQALAVYGAQTGRHVRQWGAGVVLVLALWLAGNLALHHQPTDTWRVAVVQPNLIPWAKRGRPDRGSLFQAHYLPTAELVGQDLDLVVWPETALPFHLAHYEDYQATLQRLADQLQCGLIVGTIDSLPGANGGITNAVWLFTPGGNEPQRYHKEKLVLFSERLPFILRWAKAFDPALGGFAAGTDNRAFSYRDRKLVPLVCFEALFPNYVMARPGHILVNLTNDAWFGKTKASWLHLQHIRLRSVETGAPLVRATNSGISCWVDRRGRVRDAGPLYEAGRFIYEVPVPRDVPSNNRLDGRMLIPGLQWLIVMLALLQGLIRRKRAVPPIRAKGA